MTTTTVTGVVYDDSFTEHDCLWDENYSENPGRYTCIMDRCDSLGLIDRCVRIETRPATREELLAVHVAEHVDLLESTQHYDEDQLELVSSKYDSIYVHHSTFKQSLLAAGSSIELVKAVVDGRVQNGMAFVRPPGHHAMKSEYCGYCFFNNVAIAAQYLLDQTDIRKILIVDWDIHHGQATQQMFYNDPRVLYFSIHRYEHGQFWPNLRESDFDYVGSGNGTGFNINVPLNSLAMKNEDYMAIVHYLLIPLAIEFSPDYIIVSGGYDSAIGDPKGEMLVTPACYAHITQKLMSISCGKVITILEGGYYLPSLAESAALTLRALLGDPCPLIESLQRPCDSVMETIRNVIHVHKSYWDCYKYNILAGENSPSIQYNFIIEKPEVYQTRNMYPKIDTTSLDVVLNNMILETKLFSPHTRMGLAFQTINESNENIKNSDIFQCLQSIIGHIHILKKRQATIEEINTVYRTECIKQILNQQNTEEINSDFVKKNPVLNMFCYSVGSLLQIIDSIFQNEIKSGVSVLLSTNSSNENRDTSVLNAPVVSAHYAVKNYSVKRVLIFEINRDVLHTYSDEKIMIISIHGSETVNSNKLDRNNVNISWSKGKLNNAEFTALMHYLILPIAYEYNPELIIVSTKFEPNTNETHGVQFTPIIYGHLTRWLSTLANGRLIICEQDAHNGSNYRKDCLLECSKALFGKSISKLCVNNLFSFETNNIIHDNIKNQINLWKSLQF